MALLSKNKGKVGEREAAELLREFGFEAARGVQYQGGADSQDLKHNMTGFHIEVKRTERLKMWDAMDQARNDAKQGDVPLVLHRANRKDWVVILDAKQFMELLNRYVFEPQEGSAS